MSPAAAAGRCTGGHVRLLLALCDPGHTEGLCVIQVYRPAWEVEHHLSRDGSRVNVTDVRLVDGLVQYHIQLNGQPRMFNEEPWQTLQALRVIGATLTAVDFKDGNMYCTLAESN